ncbi:MAG TPA: outer membrane protein assembly factor BamA, partial [Rhodospirillaceae bacterium]|nr:outer membrane protein assembly factor BamA [Rhodospirillaceae bacterium]
MRFVFFVAALLLPLQVFAGTISRINIEGNERTDPNTIRIYLTVREGDEATSAALDASVRSLFRSGLFQDVKLAEEDGTLFVLVKENPIINRVSVEGSDAISFDRVKSELKLGPRSIYTLSRVQDDMDRIYQLYRAKGFFAAKVEPQIIQRDQNRVDLIFKVTEGPDSRIRRIDFIGNKAFSRSDLRDQVFSIEEAWYNFLSDNDVYDPDRLNADQERLRRFYAQSGYPDFKVENAVAEFSPDQSGFFLTFTVNEGPRYQFGEVKVISEKEGLDAAPLQKLIRTETGDWYNSDKIEDTINAITDDLNRKNYAFLQVNPQVRRNEEARTIDVTYTLQDGPKIYVERIDLKGNLRTQDRVIRREFTLAEGDPLNPAKLRQSETKVKDLGYFKKTQVKQLEGSAPDRKIIEVEVEEQSTGDLQ